MGSGQSSATFEFSPESEKYAHVAEILEKKGKWIAGLVVKVSENVSLEISDILREPREDIPDDEFQIIRRGNIGGKPDVMYIYVRRLGAKKHNKRISLDLDKMQREKEEMIKCDEDEDAESLW